MRFRMQNSAFIILFFCYGLFINCESPESRGKFDGSIKAHKIRAHLQILSDDIMEGRAPGTRGIELAAKYIASQFQEAGLLPAVGDSSFFQPVTLKGIKANAALMLRGAGRFWRLKPGDEFVAGTEIEQPEVSVKNQDVIFMGYGIDAPEYNWNDYGNIDVTGKVLLMLVNEPPSQNQAFFAGEALTYYGRWTYKFEEASRRGATGVILIHTTPLAGYGWNVIQNSSREEFQLSMPAETKLLSLQAWITEEKAAEILAAAGYNLDELINRAGSSSFEPVALDLKVTSTIQNQIRTVKTVNVIAKLAGKDPTLKDECLIYTSHYDHLGIDDTAKDDGIYNGAYDNASGVAALLEIANAFAQTELNLKRTLLFAAVTAEESGLLGSEYLAGNSPFPLSKIAVNLNLDAINVWDETHDVVALGAERSTIVDIAQKAAINMGVELSPDPRPGQGSFFRSDQFSFAKKGVPAVDIKNGLKFVGQPDDWGKELMDDYVKNRYHNVRDEYEPSWSLRGTVQVAKFALSIGYNLANDNKMPQWKDGEQFKAIRDSYMDKNN